MTVSLMGLWMEDINFPDKKWYIETLMPKLNPAMFFVAGLVRQDGPKGDEFNGSWDFSLADELHTSATHKDLNYRAMSGDLPNEHPQHENFRWLKYIDKPEQYILDIKAKLQGRPYRVSIGCEPSFRGDRFTQFLQIQIKLCEFAVKHQQKISLMGLPGQHLNIFTNDFEDIKKHPLWIPWLIAVAAAYPWVVVDYHGYTGPIIAAGAYDDNYLPNIINDRDLLSDVSKYYTWDDLYKNEADPHQMRKWQTRHTFRFRWLNIYAQEQGIPQHHYFVAESPHDYYGMEDTLAPVWEQFRNIEGFQKKEDVSGINRIQKIVEWKFKKPFVEAEIEQLAWHGNMLANDRYCLAWFIYAVTGKAGDQQAYNWDPHRKILEGMIGKNPARYFTPPIQTEPKPPVVDTPPEGPKMPEVHAVKVKGTGVRLRKTPETTAPYDLQVSSGVILRVMPDDVHKAYEKIGKTGWWVHVALTAQYTGYIAADYVESILGAPEGYNWGAEFSERRLKIIDDAVKYAEDPFGDVGHELKLTLAQAVGIIEKLNI